MDEEDLVERSKSGDVAAFSDLVRLYQEKIFHLCYGIVKDEEIAEDLRQETFIRAFQNLSSFQNKSKFYTWIYRIAHNLSINYLRKKKHAREQEFNEAFSAKSLPKEEAEENELDERLHEALATLPQKQRIVFEMFILQKMSHKEIAALLDLPVGTIRSRLHYARAKVKDFLGAK